LDSLPEQLGEGLDLVRGEQRRDLLADHVAGLERAEELVGDRVEVGEVLVAEFLEAGGLEPSLGDRRVGVELLRVAAIALCDRVILCCLAYHI